MKTAEHGGNVKIITSTSLEAWLDYSTEVSNVFRCTVCGADGCHEEMVDEIFHLASQYVLVDNMPAAVCNRCGDRTLSADTVERARVMVHGKTKPVKSIPLIVYELPQDGEKAITWPPTG